MDIRISDPKKELEKCFDVEAIDIQEMIEGKVCQIVEYVNAMAVKKVPTETLLKLKKGIDNELLSRIDIDNDKYMEELRRKGEPVSISENLKRM